MNTIFYFICLEIMKIKKIYPLPARVCVHHVDNHDFPVHSLKVGDGECWNTSSTAKIIFKKTLLKNVEK